MSEPFPIVVSKLAISGAIYCVAVNQECKNGLIYRKPESNKSKHTDMSRLLY